jgi:hypothetical protein
MQFKIELTDFDLKAFIKETIEARKRDFDPGNLEPTAEFYVVDQKGSVDEKLVDEKLTEMPGRDLEKELTKFGYTVFFPFAGPSDENIIMAVDGDEYTLNEELDDEEDNEDWEPFEDIEDFTLGEMTLGYLVNVKGEEIHFESAHTIPRTADWGPILDLNNDYNHHDIGEGMRSYPVFFGGHWKKYRRLFSKRVS